MKNDRSSTWLVLASAAPLGALAAGTLLAFLDPGPGDVWGAPLWFAFFVLCVATGLEAPVLAGLWIRARIEAAGWKREARSLHDMVRARDGEIRKLRGDVEILTVIREIGVIVNADDEFEVVLTKVLELIGDAMKADELVLFMVDPASKSLEPAARRREGKVTFKRGLKKPPVSRQNVEEALVHGRLLEEQEWNAYAFSLPLVVEHEVVGVLKAFLSDPEAALKDSPKVDQARLFLRGIERHLALAIKAPSLYNRAVLDALTGLYTRRHFDAQLEGFAEMSRRRGGALSLILADIDHFKSINDTYGHQSGDRVLKGVSRVILREVRRYDMAFRYGGEELCVLLPDTELDGAAQIADRIRSKVQASSYRGDRREKISVTISMGVSQLQEWMTDPSALVETSDRALYRAKESGRNRVETELEPAGKPAKKKSARRSGRKKPAAKRSGRASKKSAGRKKASRKGARK